VDTVGTAPVTASTTGCTLALGALAPAAGEADAGGGGDDVGAPAALAGGVAAACDDGVGVSSGGCGRGAIGVAAIFAFIVSGVFLIASPGWLDGDE
jgi:hypothetical protein